MSPSSREHEAPAEGRAGLSVLDEAIARADAHAPFLRGLLRREAALVEMMREEGADAALAASVGRLDAERPAQSLREARSGVALIVALADLSGAWALEQVTAALTGFADRALDFAITAAFAERDCAVAGMTALALGKMGSFELNYSSDIDIIFVHDADRLPRRPSEDPTEAAVRIVRRVVALLAERTADGYALRVDLRLRPDPDSTPSSLPVGAAELYYQAQALAWERSAFIRARSAAGDIALGTAFLRAIQPFIWRRSLDYSALADIGDVSHRIREHFAERQTLGPGFDLKRGRGGIREVEFHAQVLQLIFGGRDPSIRAGATLDALAALARTGRMDPADADVLAEAYRYFRTLEHRFQMVGDQQTHSIPKLAAERAQVAGLMGAKSWKIVESALAPRLKAVAQRYDRLLASSGEERRGPRLPQGRASLADWGKAQKLRDPELLATLVENWRSGRPRSLRAAESRRAFEAVIPALVLGTAAGREGRQGLLRLDRLVQALPSGVQFWRLLAANPGLVTVVARLLTTTPLLADALAEKPALIDVLLEPGAPLASATDVATELRSLVRGLGEEALLDRVRIWTAERRFQIGVQLLDGAITPEAAGRLMGWMADATVALLAESVAASFAERHGRVPGAGLIVLALGRFGGGELTHQSDLDMVLLYSGEFDARSDGTQPLGASTYFNRLGARLIAALSVPTAAGPLYAVDTRLRPSGKDGLQVVSLDSFDRYQRNEAELWEAMALTRARPVAGSAEDQAAAARVLEALARRHRPGEDVRREALAMRRLMGKHKPPAGPFDVKLIRGGLVDVEYVVQARALMAARPVPPRLVDAAAAMAPELVPAARLMMDMLMLLRLVQPHDSAAAPGAATGALLARSCGKSGLAALKAGLQDARKTVDAAFAETFGARW